MTEQFEISLVFDLPIVEDEFRISSILESEFFKGSNWDCQVYESDSLSELFLSGNQKHFFDRKNIFHQITSLGALINEICRRKKFLYGVANYETNSLFISEPYENDVSRNAICKSAFIFLNKEADEKKYLNKYHVVFEYSNSKLLYNPIGQVLWSLTETELKNSC